MPAYPHIIKSTGEQEVFDPKKLEVSLMRAGASEDMIAMILQTVVAELHENMSTYDIYHRAFSLLRKNRLTKEVALKYSLRRAVAEMGPNGHPFEQFFGRLLDSQGYTTRVAIMATGWCVEHEIDVSAKKDDTHHLIECKFHNDHAIRSDLKTVLYVHARFEDIKKKELQRPEENNRFHEAWLVTNTKFTQAAVSYASCTGMRLVGWSFPHGGGIRDMMYETKIYPVTILTGLSTAQKQTLMARNIVTCDQLIGHEDILRQAGVSPKRITQVFNEITLLKNGSSQVELQ
ncbi:MAG: ATPase [Candidatus Yonathbacteria bacterium]|nr:ATPase [Candidatus Yonathbacteria bacterium]